MTTITIGHTKDNQITAIVKSVYEFLKSFRQAMTTPPTPLVLDPRALREMGARREEVENLRHPAWQNIGQYL